MGNVCHAADVGKSVRLGGSGCHDTSLIHLRRALTSPRAVHSKWMFAELRAWGFVAKPIEPDGVRFEAGRGARHASVVHELSDLQSQQSGAAAERQTRTPIKPITQSTALPISASMLRRAAGESPRSSALSVAARRVPRSCCV